MFDERGLYLEVSPAGGKWWRLKYRIGGKEKRLSLGVYPDVSLRDARERRDEARKLVANGTDPSLQRKAQKLAAVASATESFEAVAREWMAKYSPNWAPDQVGRICRMFEMDVFPFVGKRPISTLQAPELLALLRRVEARTLDTAHRVLRNCGKVFRYGIATGRCTRDLSADLRGALPPTKKKHFAATLEPKRLGSILQSLDSHRGTFVVQCALKLVPLLFVRPGELRSAEWSQFNLGAASWEYRTTKTDTPHVVPLSRQALSILQDLYTVTGRGRYVFPSARGGARCMSENAVNIAMRTLEIEGDEMCGHGFRAVARTILDEVLNFRPDIIEHQLAHAVKDPNGRAYNRTSHLPERKKMMQAWADHLDSLKKLPEVLPFPRRA